MVFLLKWNLIPGGILNDDWIIFLHTMFGFLFSGTDAISRVMTESPKVTWLFSVFLFLGGAVGISLWEVPVERVSSQLPVVSISDCDSRSLIDSFLLSGNRSRRTLASDDCGEEAVAWSQQVALKKRESSGNELSLSDNLLDTEILSLTAGYPIEYMSTSIAKYDRKVAALLVGIAKKESNWGKRVPRSDDGSDCFNYWGFKGAGSRGVAMGHGCFGSPEEAVEKVGNRIAELVELRSTSEPKNFTIWKCGSSCATHSPESVRKWVSDVDQYYRLLAIR